MSSIQRPPPNPLFELTLTLVVPSLVLDNLSSPSNLGPVGALLVSMVFPLGFAIWCWWQKMGWNVFSALGLVTILLSGGLGLLKLDAVWFSLKESAMPLIIGAAFPLSHHWGRPLIRALLLQPHLFRLDVLDAAVAEGEKARRYHSALLGASWMLGLGMAGSAALNFFLALWLLGGKAPGSEAFVKGIGTLNWASLVVVGVPLLAVMMGVFAWLIRRIHTITGLERGEFMNLKQRHPAREENPPCPD